MKVKKVMNQLKQGGTLKIPPGKIHWAEGNETWVECYSTPGWDKNDHVLVLHNPPRPREVM